MQCIMDTCVCVACFVQWDQRNAFYPCFSTLCAARCVAVLFLALQADVVANFVSSKQQCRHRPALQAVL